MKQLLCTLLVLGLSTITACDRDERAGPPTLRLGRDECAECGMAIHEERSAAAMLIDRDGRHDYLLFDDIGCMVDAEWSKASELKVLERYVHDHAANVWIRADTAVFLGTDGSSLHTPMASGVAAYAERAGAEAGQQQFGGEVLTFGSLAVWRRARMEERRASPGK